MVTKSFDRLGYVYKLMVIIALSITAIILCRDIVIPFAFAAFLSVVMLPLVKRIERKTGLTLAVTITLVGTIIILGLLGWLLVDQIISLINDLPNLEAKFTQFVTRLRATLSSQLGMQVKEQDQMAKDLAKGISVYIGAFLKFMS